MPQLAGPKPDRQALREAIAYHLRYSLGKTWERCSPRERWLAVSLAVRHWVIDAMLATEARYREADAKRLYYLSMEFLVGRSLGTNLFNLGIVELCREVLAEQGVVLEELWEEERDAALGNGGLGRLAACFLDSLATLGMPGYGYGINYEYGLFRQVIEHGYQREQPDQWRTLGSPWLLPRPEEALVIPLYGRLTRRPGGGKGATVQWVDYDTVIGVPYDLPIVGYGGHTVNVLRLFTAKASHEFDMQVFNRGDYLRAVERKVASELISKVLYPSDAVDAGRELRLLQEYFLVACALRDLVRRYRQNHDSFAAFASKVAVQLNDTHPALAVAELMRLLVDDHGLPWAQAWELTQATLAYTNHTLLPEALEQWPVPLLEAVLPRHLQIIYDINHDFLQQVRARWPGDVERLRRMSIIEEGDPKQVRMAHLAIVGSHAVNGVSALHSRLIQTRLVPDFYQLWPERFTNKTNGITQRRWLLQANPRLARLLSDTIGDAWITDLERLRALEPYADDAAFQAAFRAIKRENKERLARVIRDTTGLVVDPASLFDVHIKRIHEYKRQLLNVLHIIHLYLALVEDGEVPPVPRTFIFAGKAAPGYWAAKQIIKLIHNVGQVVNGDPRVRGRLKVVFIPDYRVSLAEKIIPAAEVSEQISTAGTEASGTGNMKLALNGALTVGTLDGANIEIREEVGEENIFIFGHTAEEIARLRQQGAYDPRAYCQRYPQVQRVMEGPCARRSFAPTSQGSSTGSTEPWWSKAILTSTWPTCRLTLRRSNRWRHSTASPPSGRARRFSTWPASASSPATARCASTPVTSGSSSPSPEASALRLAPGAPLPLGASRQAGGLNFAVFAPVAQSVTLLLFWPGAAEPTLAVPLTARTGQIWHLRIEGLPAGVTYAYAVTPAPPGAALPWLLDPYARCLVGAEVWRGEGGLRPRRAALVEEPFDWQGDRPLRRPLADTVIYELHVRGFTCHPSAGVAHPGTFAGLRAKIPYLQELGITAVELMPVTEFEENDNPRRNPLTGERLVNFWGYHPLALFAPKASYAASATVQGQVREFKELVRALHAAGIEVILDLVCTHTGEGEETHPTWSYRGLANEVYYLREAGGRYANFSGCGNTVNGNHPVVQDLIVDCLRYWVTEMHVDGFRLDLAAILCRGPAGEVLDAPPLLARLAADPVLADTKLIAEPWDAAGLYLVGRFPHFGRWAEWNDRFRDEVRRFVRGDAGMVPALAARLAGSPDLYQAQGRPPCHSINFVTCHDGFTLADVVSYNHKHNEANGEGNADGAHENYSWNCGVEGESDDPAVVALRRRQAKNLLTLLLMAQGVPMLLAGDEMGRTQRGNNNAYCQDNEVSWVNWEGQKTHAELVRFVRLLIARRKHHAVLRARHYPGSDHPQAPRLTWHGVQVNQPDWSWESRSLAMQLQDAAGSEHLYLIAHAHWEARRFALPALPPPWRWCRAIDTALPCPEDICPPGSERPLADPAAYGVEARSVVVLVGRPAER
ncbi:MAG: hypothetical protein KatS3mg131_1561 [Candidatus Tectimicrobiota bacterium]|nr:MAG: hypothetical protein KatS3mg131_1561 [Candidatus Tectomicrobia bacterium]